jgi:hypothetical protein
MVMMLPARRTRAELSIPPTSWFHGLLGGQDLLCVDLRRSAVREHQGPYRDRLGGPDVSAPTCGTMGRRAAASTARVDAVLLGRFPAMVPLRCPDGRPVLWTPRRSALGADSHGKNASPAGGANRSKTNSVGPACLSSAGQPWTVRPLGPHGPRLLRIGAGVPAFEHPM